MTGFSTSRITEQPNPRSRGLDRKSTVEVLRTINDEDRRVAEAVSEVIDDIARAVDHFVERYRHGGRIVYVGAGTSGRLGVLDAAECPPTFGTPPERIRGVLAGGPDAFFRATEGHEDDREAGRAVVEQEGITSADFVLGIAASGETPFVVGCVEAARALGAVTVGLANNPDSTLAKHVDVAIVPVVGPEVIAGSTRMKAGTAQKMVLNMLSTAAMVQLGKVYDNLMIDVQAGNRKLKERAREILKLTTGREIEAVDAALAAAQFELKPALLMLKANVSRVEAQALLDRHEGRVRDALQELGWEDE